MFYLLTGRAAHHVDAVLMMMQGKRLSIDKIVGYAGDYAGCAINFIVPACLAYFSRR